MESCWSVKYFLEQLKKIELFFTNPVKTNCKDSENTTFLHLPIVAKRELSMIYRSIYVHTLSYSHRLLVSIRMKLWI